MAAPAAALLDAWRRALVGVVRMPGPDLTARQLAILLTVYTGAPPHSVVGLAEAFAVPHQAVSRAVATLERQDLVRRTRCPTDRRVQFVQRTVKGAVYLRDLADLIGDTSG